MLGDYYIAAVGAALLASATMVLATPGVIKRDVIRVLRNNNGTGIALGSLYQVPFAGDFYAIDVAAGFPSQSMIMALDTGSSDIIVLGKQVCQLPQALCNPSGNYPSIDGGSYNPNMSFSSHLVSNNFDAAYEDTTTFNGSYWMDSLTIAGLTLVNMTLGVIEKAFAPPDVSIHGILGIGTLVQRMKSQGLIGTMGYSLYLNDAEASSGAVLFGGIDTAKYTGSLSPLPVLSNMGPGMFVAWTALTFSDPDGNVTLLSTPIPALLDSGISNIVLTSDLANAIFSGLGISNTSGYIMPCDYGYDEASFTFGFNYDLDANITVPLSALITPLLSDGLPQIDEDGDALCSLGVSPYVTGDYVILGEYFLRSAYVVYDLEKNIVSIAQANLNTTESNIIPIAATSGLGASTATNTVTASPLPSQTNIPNPTITVTPTAATISLASLTPTFKIGKTPTKSAAPAATKKSAAEAVSRAHNAHLALVVFGIVTALVLLGG